MIKEIFQGRWLGHPLHPAIVHIPIALWIGTLIFDILADLGVGGNTLVQASFWAILIGLISVILVVPAGIADWADIKSERPAWKLGLYHMVLNVIAAIFFAFNLGIRVGDHLTVQNPSTAELVLSIIGVAILLVSGYLGGLMVYDHGISVARQSKREWRAVAAAAGANLPPES